MKVKVKARVKMRVRLDNFVQGPQKWKNED
jgi:hypothetical protein